MGETRVASLEWLGQGLRFAGRGAAPATPTVVIDGDAEAGPSPMITLLLAAGGCSAADIVHILGKMRAGLRSLVLEVSGERRDAEPRRYIALRLVYRMAGDDLDRLKAERAVELSLEKYCSVVHSLAPDITVDYAIELE